MRCSLPAVPPGRPNSSAASSSGTTPSTPSAAGWTRTDRSRCTASQPDAGRSRVTWHANLKRGGGVAAEEAAGELYELYQAQYGNVVAMAYALTGDLAEAQDLVQEGFCRAWQRWRRIAGYDDPLAWVD